MYRVLAYPVLAAALVLILIDRAAAVADALPAPQPNMLTMALMPSLLMIGHAVCALKRAWL
ncbi:MAG TPA: hypothetical protein VIL42_00410 [Sphingomicrobium sp.]|jgi:hypothetical protein